MRKADFIEVALANLSAALRDGTLLVVVVTIIFLAHFGPRASRSSPRSSPSASRG